MSFLTRRRKNPLLVVTLTALSALAAVVYAPRAPAADNGGLTNFGAQLACLSALAPDKAVATDSSKNPLATTFPDPHHANSRAYLVTANGIYTVPIMHEKFNAAKWSKAQGKYRGTPEKNGTEQKDDANFLKHIEKSRIAAADAQNFQTEIKSAVGDGKDAYQAGAQVRSEILAKYTQWKTIPMDLQEQINQYAMDLINHHQKLEGNRKTADHPLASDGKTDLASWSQNYRIKIAAGPDHDTTFNATSYFTGITGGDYSGAKPAVALTTATTSDAVCDATHHCTNVGYGSGLSDALDNHSKEALDSYIHEQLSDYYGSITSNGAAKPSAAGTTQANAIYTTCSAIRGPTGILASQYIKALAGTGTAPVLQTREAGGVGNREGANAGAAAGGDPCAKAPACDEDQHHDADCGCVDD